jgi:hypothetical protein
MFTPNTLKVLSASVFIEQQEWLLVTIGGCCTGIPKTKRAKIGECPTLWEQLKILGKSLWDTYKGRNIICNMEAKHQSLVFDNLSGTLMWSLLPLQMIMATCNIQHTLTDETA